MIASWGNSSSNCISQLQYGIRRLKEAPEFGFGQCHHAQLPSSSLRATNAPGHRAGTGGSWSLRAWQLLGPSVPAVATAKIREKVSPALSPAPACTHTGTTTTFSRGLHTRFVIFFFLTHMAAKTTSEMQTVQLLLWVSSNSK